MITKSNLRELLTALHFNQSGNQFSKHFELQDVDLKVDFDDEQLIYPESAKGIKIHSREICNFSQSENFVVFECVYRLLEKGYLAKHIELEPKWKVGHGASGGKADILIRDNNGKSLLIIECKTWGKEFENAWKDTQENGAQLFSYFHQDKDTQFVSLYASDFDSEKINYIYKLIATKDNEEYLKGLKKGVPSFKDAKTVKASFKAWSETYQKDYSEVGLFENNLAAYNIGKNKYSINDLKEMDADNIQNKYHEFATILRQHNVSGRENAFDKLVNLFLAKIVDENQNKKELAFYWKGIAYDDAKSLTDRLQKLYKIGMKKFLGEEVTYIEKAQINDAFKLFKNDPDATRERVLEYFDELKYYTNNDFAFIDVHNKNLFYQNAEVFLKIVKMLQDIKLQTDTQNQFLGDLFEGFLDKGIKQSEGQYFTPMPIVKFLVSSLPLQKAINENTEPLKMIDYACGAGHFLNEYANQILSSLTVTTEKIIHGRKVTEIEALRLRDYYEQIIGIEKEYRLSKVAKVSAFMYGQDEITIIYDDALKVAKKVKDNSFDILVSNPPYSVKGFLETLDEDDLERYELMNFVDDKQKKTNNSIECFFVERAKQLLKAGGVAAIILPSSVLSKGNIYTKTREILLKYFDIVAIAEFGSGTFSKTTTNTATLFLRRKGNSPDAADHYANRVESWFKGDFRKDPIFNDAELLKKYCDKIQISLTDYKTLLKGKPSEGLLNTEIFKEYKKDFKTSTVYKNIHKSQKTSDEKKESEEKQFYEYVQTIEKEKLYFFVLAESNPQPVVLVKSPAENKLLKNFLGYEWSSAKGDEGIKYIGAKIADEEDTISINKGINQIKTPLFNPRDLNDRTKINTIIRNNFAGTNPQNPQPDFVSFAKLSDMLDFSHASFDKAIKTTPEKKIEIVSKYEFVQLGELAEIVKGVTYAKTDEVADETNNIILTADNITLDGQFIVSKKIYLQENKVLDKSKKLKKNDLFMCFSSGSKQHIGKLTFIEENQPYYAGGFMGILRISKNGVSPKFLFEILNAESLRNVMRHKASGANINNLSSSISEIKIPLPPLNIQQKIVAECGRIDEEYSASHKTIEDCKSKISQLFERENNNKGRNLVKINKLCKYSDKRINCELLTSQNYVGVDNLLQDTQGKTDSNFVLTSGTATEYKAGDILLSNIRPYLKKIWFADINGGSSNDVLVLQKTSDEIISKYLFYNLKQDKFFDYEMQSIKGMKMPRGDKKQIMNYQIPVPSLADQQKIVAEIEVHEAKIAEAQKIMNEAGEKKKKILEKYL